jgi:hypothetical protein
MRARAPNPVGARASEIRRPQSRGRREIGIGKVPPRYVAALDRFSTVVRRCQTSPSILVSLPAIPATRDQIPPLECQRHPSVDWFPTCLQQRSRTLANPGERHRTMRPRTSKPVVGILGDVDGRIVPVAPPPVCRYELDVMAITFAAKADHVAFPPPRPVSASPANVAIDSRSFS